MSKNNQKKEQEQKKQEVNVKKEEKNIIIESNKTFHVIYPCYIDKNLTMSQGRKIPKEKAVDKPTAKEIYDICIHLKLNCVLEKAKMHPKDVTNEGRVKVELKKDNNLITKFKSSK